MHVIYYFAYYVFYIGEFGNTLGGSDLSSIFVPAIMFDPESTLRSHVCSKVLQIHDSRILNGHPLIPKAFRLDLRFSFLTRLSFPR